MKIHLKWIYEYNILEKKNYFFELFTYMPYFNLNKKDIKQENNFKLFMKIMYNFFTTQLYICIYTYILFFGFLLAMGRGWSFPLILHSHKRWSMRIYIGPFKIAFGPYHQCVFTKIPFCSFPSILAPTPSFLPFSYLLFSFPLFLPFFFPSFLSFPHESLPFLGIFFRFWQNYEITILLCNLYNKIMIPFFFCFLATHPLCYKFSPQWNHDVVKLQNL